MDSPPPIAGAPPAAASTRPSVALVVVAVINLVIGVWFAGSAAWMAAVAPGLAYTSGHLLGQSEYVLKEGQAALGKPVSPPVDFEQLGQQLGSALRWSGLSALGWYTVGLALLITSIALLCGRAWARPTSCALCVGGALLQVVSIVYTLVAYDVPTTPVGQGVLLAKYAAVITSAGLLAYFTLAVAVLWNGRRVRLPTLPSLPSLPTAPPEPMGFPAHKRAR